MTHKLQTQAPTLYEVTLPAETFLLVTIADYICGKTLFSYSAAACACLDLILNRNHCRLVNTWMGQPPGKCHITVTLYWFPQTSAPIQIY